MWRRSRFRRPSLSGQVPVGPGGGRCRQKRSAGSIAFLSEGGRFPAGLPRRSVGVTLQIVARIMKTLGGLGRARPGFFMRRSRELGAAHTHMWSGHSVTGWRCRLGAARAISLGRSLRPSWPPLTRRRLHFGILPALAAYAGSMARAAPRSLFARSPGRKSGGAYVRLHQPVTTNPLDARSPPMYSFHLSEFVREPPAVRYI